jgi:predicted  nucleic acid-binding Zn-ribbon protein
VKPTLLALLRLAEVDNKIDQIIKEQRDIPALVKEISTEIITRQKEVNEKKGHLAELQAQQKTINEFLTEKKVWVEDREKRINELKTNKEYQATLREISNAKRDIKTNEETLATLLPQIEAASQTAGGGTEDSEKKIEALKQSIQDYKTRFDASKEILAEEKRARDVLARDVTDKKLLAHYEQIHKRVSPVLAKANDGVCCECGTRILPQVFNLLSLGDSIQTCNGCKRILYLEESLTA